MAAVFGFPVAVVKPIMDVQTVDDGKISPSKKTLQPTTKDPRYIPAALKHHIWFENKGECQVCKSKKNLNYDHVHPVALGGETTKENLRLLCINCNQRQSIKRSLKD